MNDEFLEILRAEPRPEFAEALWERLSTITPTSERTVPMTTTITRPAQRFALRPLMAGLLIVLLAAAGTVALSPSARAACAGLWHNISGLTIHEQSTPNIVGLTPPAPVGENSPGRPLPTLEIGTGGPLPFAVAAAQHRAHGYKLPDTVVQGYSPEPMASANAGSRQGVSEFRWASSSGGVIIFDVSVRPDRQSPSISSVGIGSVTDTKVSGWPAAYIEWDWSRTSPAGEWDPNALRRVVWYEGDVEYVLSTTDTRLGMADLLGIAESAR